MSIKTSVFHCMSVALWSIVIKILISAATKGLVKMSVVAMYYLKVSITKTHFCYLLQIFKMVQIAAVITYSRCCCGRGADAPGARWREEQKRAGCGTVAGPAGRLCWTQSWEVLCHSAGCSSASQMPGGWIHQSSPWTTMRRTNVNHPTSVH